MSYRCQLCTNAVPPHRPLTRHVVLRPRLDLMGRDTGCTEIAREIPVCQECLRLLTKGSTPAQVTRLRAPTVCVPEPLRETLAAHASARVLGDGSTLFAE